LSLSISEEQFEQQMAWLMRHRYTTISLDQWQSALQGEVHRPILLTFDDAYADLCNHALPLLRRLGLRATVFAVSSFLGAFNNWDVERGFAPCPLMTEQQVLYWASQGIDFGAHSRTHPFLTELDSSSLTKEIEDSAMELGGLLDRPVSAFAYPYGYHNRAVRRCVASKFELAFTCMGGLNHARTDPYRLRRSMVQPHDSQIDFLMRVRFGHAPISSARSGIRLRTRLRAAFGLSGREPS
jgi:peptidoglycan/xylan/chitin deacetylase (PgdA/CDA1 family)